MKPNYKIIAKDIVAKAITPVDIGGVYYPIVGDKEKQMALNIENALEAAWSEGNTMGWAYEYDNWVRI